MPEYQGLIKDGRLNYTRQDLLDKWCERNDGLWFKTKLEIVGKVDDPKTSQQLGYYWGLLVPEACAELNRLGHTNTIQFGKFTREVPFNKYSTHELLTGLCGYVGFDAAHIRLSGADKYKAIKFVDNVVAFMVDTLGMDERRLKAWRRK